MVSPIVRMRTFRGRIALVRNGLGAAILPPSVTRLALHFAKKDHYGPRKFWRLIMPRLKYHNPNVQMDIERPEIWGGKAELTIEFDNGKTKVIDCLGKDEKDIAKTVIRATGAKELPISEEDNQLVNEYLKFKTLKKEGELEKLARRRANKINAPSVPGMSETA